MRALSLALALGVLAAGLAGCVAPSALQTASTPDLVDQVLGQVRLLEEGGFEMDVPVDVVLLGFPAEVATQLQARLKPTPIDHADGSFPRNFPPDPSTPGWEAWRAPTQPVAVFRVHDLDAAFEEAFYAAAAAWKIEDSKRGAYAAEPAEAYLAEKLQGAGIALDPDNPLLVVLHGGEALGEHAWRVTFTHGYIEPVRIFGERLPLTVFDVSAIPDPYVVGGSSFFSLVFPAPRRTQPYNHPVEASGDDALEALEALVVDAAHYRFLKGPIYPISTKPCHHVTLLLGVHQTALSEALPGYKRARDLVDVAALEGAFENLTRDDVTVELKVLSLPRDDPVLDALSRGAGFATLDALRWHLDENFETYVTPQEGCEEYLSLLSFGDAAMQGMFGGIGTYDVKRSHRISFSLVNDVDRLLDGYHGPGKREDPSRVWNMVNLLYSHETGHLFGQHHPQHLSDTEGKMGANSAFEAVYSVMAYQQVDRNVDFGAVDHSTWARGRVGYTIRDAQELGLTGTPQFAEALAKLERGEWADAHLALEPLVQDANAAQAEGDHTWGSHEHPWG